MFLWRHKHILLYLPLSVSNVETWDDKIRHDREFRGNIKIIKTTVEYNVKVRLIFFILISYSFSNSYHFGKKHFKIISFLFYLFISVNCLKIKERNYLFSDRLPFENQRLRRQQIRHLKLKFRFLTSWWKFNWKMSTNDQLKDENFSPGNERRKSSTPKRSPSTSSSPLQIIRNFASLSNRGSPSPLKTPFGKLFRKVKKYFLSDIYMLLSLG